MKRLMTATAAVALTAGAALAATDIDAVDLNGDNFASMEEVKAVFPDFDVTFFDDIDTNNDNRVSPQEILTTEAQNILGRYDMVPLEARGPVIILDNDADGFISLEDMRRGYPTFTDLDFETIDLNDDNRIAYVEIYETEAQDIIARYTTDTVKDIAEIDVNGDDFADFNEMIAAYPGLPMVEFEEIDGNDDNRISSEELYAPEAQTIVSRYES